MIKIYVKTITESSEACVGLFDFWLVDILQGLTHDGLVYDRLSDSYDYDWILLLAQLLVLLLQPGDLLVLTLHPAKHFVLALQTLNL